MLAKPIRGFSPSELLSSVDLANEDIERGGGEEDFCLVLCFSVVGVLGGFWTPAQR